MGDILPPPSTGVPAVQDRKGNFMDFTAIWRGWFIDLTATLNKSGGTSGGVPATRQVLTTSPISGGGDLSQDLTLKFTPAGAYGAVQVNSAGALGGVTGATGTVTLIKLTPGGANGSLTVVDGIITAIAPPT